MRPGGENTLTAPENMTVIADVGPPQEGSESRVLHRGLWRDWGDSLVNVI